MKTRNYPQTLAVSLFVSFAIWPGCIGCRAKSEQIVNAPPVTSQPESQLLIELKGLKSPTLDSSQFKVEGKTIVAISRLSDDVLLKLLRRELPTGFKEGWEDYGKAGGATVFQSGNLQLTIETQRDNTVRIVVERSLSGKG